MEQKDNKVNAQNTTQTKGQEEQVVEDFKNVRFQIREFEWFEAESKIRNYVCELLQPTLKRFAQEQKSIDNLNIELQNTNIRLQELKDIVLNSETKIPIFEKIKQQFYEMESKFLQTEINIKYTVEKIKVDLNALQREQNNQLNQMQKVHESKQYIEQIHAQAINDIQQYKKQSSEQIQNMQIELLNQGQILRQQVQEIDQQIIQHDNLFQEKQISLDTLQIQQVEQKNQITDLEQQINKFAINLGKSDSEINVLKGNIQFAKKSISKMDALTVKIQEIENFIDKYLPLFTYSQISEILYQCINNKNKCKLVNFEDSHLLTFNNVILQDNGIGNLSQKIKSSQQIIEKIMIRNKNFKNQFQENQPSIDASDDKNSQNNTISDQQENKQHKKSIEYQQINDKFNKGKQYTELMQSEIQKITQQNVEKQSQYIIQKIQEQINQLKSEIVANNNLIMKQIDTNYEQNELTISKEHAFIEKLSETIKNLNNDHILDKGNLQSKINASYTELEKIVNAFNKLSDTVYKLLHFSTLQHHLNIQDELDKQGIALFGFKNTYNDNQQQNSQDNDTNEGSISKNSQFDQHYQTKSFFTNNTPIHSQVAPQKKEPTIKLDTKCISCNGQAAMITNAFKMACLIYQPSNIILGGKTYKRDELLKISSKILTSAKQQYGIKNTSPIQTDIQPQLQQLQQQYQELQSKQIDQTLIEMNQMLNQESKTINKKYINLESARKRVVVQRKLFSQNEQRNNMAQNQSFVHESIKNQNGNKNLDISLPNITNI